VKNARCPELCVRFSQSETVFDAQRDALKRLLRGRVGILTLANPPLQAYANQRLASKSQNGNRAAPTSAFSLTGSPEADNIKDIVLAI
jgi:predicted deacylase